ncbi:MAG: aminoacyl--tRNA ligase-related protein [Candidatus Thermoplasmatota archaeon]|nr:aminoacyl--tRNA ligase-related protein [Candidatus Thermoplasmatota archaeon]
MKFDLKCRFMLSKEVGRIDEFLKNFVEGANEGILRRGAIDEGARIVEWNAEGDSITMGILSEGNIRSHEGAIRIRKALSNALGKEYRVGVREIVLIDYIINLEVEQKPLKEFSIPFAELKIDGNMVEMRIRDKGEEFLRENYIDRMIHLVKEKIKSQYYEGKKEYWELIWKSDEKNPVWHEDPSEEMQKLGWIVPGSTKGKWFYRPPAAAIMRAMEKIALEEVVLPLGFNEVIEPMHVSLEMWLKTGHLEGMPGEMYYLCEPSSRDQNQWERFIDLVKITKEVPEEELKKNLKSPKAGVCYAQCPNIYFSFSGKTISDDSLPILLFERSVPSNRYESGGRHGIERVDEFHRIEVVCIGTRAQLISLREKLMERYSHVFNDVLELEWRMAKVTPFYMQQAGVVGQEEEADKGTIDFEVWLPYGGDRSKEWLEIQNISIIGDKYTKAFNIKGQKSQLWSGCSGIGLERLTIAFLSQKGIDPDKWPTAFKKYLPELPGMTEFL